LQDSLTGVFDPAFSVFLGLFAHRRDAESDSSSNSRDDASASSFGHPDGWPGSPCRGELFPVASGFFGPAGIPEGYNTPGSSPGGSEEKRIGNANSVSGPWLPSRGNHKSDIDSLKRKKIEKWGMVGEEKGRK
jgi:hypothetical protein